MSVPSRSAVAGKACAVALTQFALVGLSHGRAVEKANLANLCGRDHLGRELVSFEEAGPERGRQVGLFYYLWHGQHGTQGLYDIPKMEREDPDVMDNPDSPLRPDPAHAPLLHWGEPLFVRVSFVQAGRNGLHVDATAAFSLEFKWSDNRQADDPMDFYVHGDAARSPELAV